MSSSDRLVVEMTTSEEQERNIKTNTNTNGNQCRDFKISPNVCKLVCRQSQCKHRDTSM